MYCFCRGGHQQPWSKKACIAARYATVHRFLQLCLLRGVVTRPGSRQYMNRGEKLQRAATVLLAMRKWVSLKKIRSSVSRNGRANWKSG